MVGFRDRARRERVIKWVAAGNVSRRNNSNKQVRRTALHLTLAHCRRAKEAVSSAAPSGHARRLQQALKLALPTSATSYASYAVATHPGQWEMVSPAVLSGEEDDELNQSTFTHTASLRLAAPLHTTVAATCLASLAIQLEAQQSYTLAASGPMA